MDLQAIQNALQENRLDAWLFYDHHHRDPIAYSVLGLSDHLHVTRRWYYLIPAQGEPQKLVHNIESGHLDTLPGGKRSYSSWQEQQRTLQEMTANYPTIAMQYSPNNLVPYIGLVDAGTIELVRSFGRTIVSSGDLVSRFEAMWTEAQIASHYAARDSVDQIMAAAFQEIGRRARNGGTHEYEIAQFIQEAFMREKMTTEPPIVGVNAHSADPHYSPDSANSLPIREGDFVLLDMWGRKLEGNSVYYDITWTGVVGTPSLRHQEIFEIVRDARKAAVKTVQSAFDAQKKISGCEVDDAARGHIRSKGYADQFFHRTGHSIGSSDVHGNGANIDNVETKDDRLIIPNTCFSIEPGIYLTGDFGVRSEVNVLIEKGKAVVTGREQEELVRI